MPKEAKERLPESPCFSAEQENKAIMRCFNAVDYISETAANIIIDVLYNIPCPEAKQFLLTRPEELALRAFEKALSEFGRGGRRPGEQTH
jgi:hypothetical protein